ncbi:aminotransferase class I/II-fold pyridoxal phosphate-dependent enzyme, partial [Pseudomonas viridiflava]|uniref:aminotransferase class I/II-fold pyridoxal phosphate-dependent enzyme n=1 Tax=Pseudomonas viridiflava TaxID=33069 RepID=UPI000F030ECE
WADEVEEMRQRVAQLRSGLVEALTPLGLGERLLTSHSSAECFPTPASPANRSRLREEQCVYMVNDGRANMAGIDASRLDQLAQAIAAVCKG